MVHFPHLEDGKLSEDIYNGKIKVSVFLCLPLPSMLHGESPRALSCREPSFRMCVDAVGGMSSEVCHGDVCGHVWKQTICG